MSMTTKTTTTTASSKPTAKKAGQPVSAKLQTTRSVDLFKK